MLALGIFIACDLGLRREHYLVTELGKSGQHIEFKKAPYPLTKKFGWFATICIVVFGVVVCLVVVKDLTWLANIDEEKDMKQAALSVSLEIGFVVLVILAYNLVVISQMGNFPRTCLLLAMMNLASLRKVPTSQSRRYELVQRNLVK